MNKKLIALTILAGSTFFTAAHAADGTINFTGTIMDASCNVTTATQNQTVPLGNVNRTAFSAAGDTAAPTKFSIILENCPTTVTKATVRFDGPIDSANKTLLALTPAGSGATNATGVAVGIYEDDAATQIPIATKSKEFALSSTANNELEFIAKYVSTAAAVTQGTANASTNFTIDYQ